MLERQPGDIGTVVRCLHRDRTGARWIGCEFGLFSWDKNELKTFSMKDGFSPAYVLAITEDKAGDIWLGTALGELRHVHAGKFESFRPNDSLTDESTLKAAVASDPLSVRTQNDDGSTSATFANGRSVKVPPLTDAETAISSTAGTNGLWLTVLENAFGKFRQPSQPGDPADEPDTDAIAHGGKPGYVISTLAGYKTKAYTLMLATGQHHTAQYPTNLMDDLSAALQNHRLAEATTATNSLPPGINPKHAYAILGFNRDTGSVRLWNPHGNNFKPKGPDGPQFGYVTKAGQFDLPLKDLPLIYKSVIIETPIPNQP